MKNILKIYTIIFGMILAVICTATLLGQHSLSIPSNHEYIRLKDIKCTYPKAGLRCWMSKYLKPNPP